MFDKKRVYFEFLGKSTCQITTPLRQKVFELDGECIVNLTTFNLENGSWNFTYPPSNFFAAFAYDEDSDSYMGEVVAQIREGEIDIIGVVGISEDNYKAFRISVWY